MTVLIIKAMAALSTQLTTWATPWVSSLSSGQLTSPLSSRDVIHLPMRSSPATTALTPTSHFASRALLSLADSRQQDQSLSLPAQSSKRALIPGSVSTALSNLNHYFERTLHGANTERKPQHNSSSNATSDLISRMCSCPAQETANITAMKRYGKPVANLGQAPHRRVYCKFSIIICICVKPGSKNQILIPCMWSKIQL